MHYAHIAKVLSFVDVDGTLPEVIITILVYLFCVVGTLKPILDKTRVFLLYTSVLEYELDT